MANFPAQVLQPDGAERRARDVDMVIVGAGIISGAGDLHLASNGGVVVIDTGVKIESVSGTDAFIEGAGGSTVAVAPASRGRIRYNETTNKWQLSENAGAFVDMGTGSLAIGAPVTGATPGSVLFVDAGGNLGEDPAGLVYDDTINVLLVTGTLAVNDNATALATISVTRAPGVATAGVGVDVSLNANTTGRAVQIVQAGIGDGINLAMTNPGAIASRGLFISIPATHVGSAIEISSSGNGPGSSVLAGHLAGNQHAFQATMAATATGSGLVVTHSGLSGNGIVVNMTPGAASTLTGISVSGNASTNGIGVSISHAGTGTGLSVTGASTATARGVLVTYSGSNTAVQVDHPTGAGDSVFISRTPAVSTAGSGFRVSYGTNTTGNPITISQSGTGRPIEITHTAGGNSSIRVNRSPAVATGGAGLDIIYGANTTGTPVLASSSGSGDVAVFTGSGSGTALNLGNSGSGATILFTHTGTSTGPYFFGHSANTAGVTVQFSRTPSVATGGSIIRISANPSFTGVDLEMFMGGTSDTGIAMTVRGSGNGIALFDQVPNAHTGTALRIQHSQTGSTGLLIEMTKNPAAATAGDIASILVGANATGNIWTVSHGGTGLYQSVSITGGGGGITITETGTLGAGVQFSLSRATNSTAIMASIVRSPATSGTTGENLRISTNGNAVGHGIRILSGVLAGMTCETIAVQGAGAGLRIVEDIPGAANTGIACEIIRTLNGSTGVLLSLSKTPAAGAATGGNIVTWTMGGAGATTGDVFGGTGTATNTGRFITTSWLGTGEIWRFTGAGGVLLTTMSVDGRLGLGLEVAHVQSRLHVKEHAAFPGSGTETSTGSGTTVGAVTADLFTLTLVDNTQYWVEVRIVGRDAGGVEFAAYVVRARVGRQGGGGATFGGASPATSFTDETSAGLDGTLAVVGNTVIARVTGVAAVTINWVCDIQWQGVSTAA